MRRKSPLYISILLILLLLFSFAVISFSFAESSYDASTMRLLRHDGTVQIYDVSGAPRFLLDNVRFASGEAMETGEDGTASVSLDDSKIVSLDKLSFVEFMQESDHIRLNLKKGTIFLDVSEKLDENAGLDIQTSTMTVGIRGTIVQVSEEESSADPGIDMTTLAVFEGVTNVTYTDEAGASRLVSVPAGQKFSVPKNKAAGKQGVSPVVSALTSNDVKDVSRLQINSNPVLLERIINGSPQGTLVLNGTGTEDENQPKEPFPASGEWEYTDPVILVAQSASKLYDGTPLTRPEALVQGLPTGMKITLKITGSITDAGTEKNTVTDWSIFNSSGEDITSHIKNVQRQQGDLVVDPAPIYVWTGSAEKTYDGNPLTCDEAEIHTIQGQISTDPDWKNSSIVTRTALGSERMVGLNGNTLVHGTNPLTGETKETTLKTGEALTVTLHSEAGQGSIEYVVEQLDEKSLPDEVVRLYADNPDLLASACEETGWNPDIILDRAKTLSAGTRTSQNGLKVTDEASNDIVINSTNVRIQVDSDFISYDSRALDGNEARFAPIRIDPSIEVIATGSQTDIGSSPNTCSINWHNAKRSNYILREDLGTLTVLEPEKPQITVTANSAEKVYDGTPLEVSTFSISGLPAGWTARAIYSGSRTDVGTDYNTISSITIRDENDEIVTDKCSVILNPGTLTVTPATLTVTTGSAEKTYDGEPLTCDEASISGLVSGETATVTATGSQTEVGSSDNTYTITWGSASESNYSVSDKLGTLEVKEGDNYSAAITITSASKSMEYSGKELTDSGYDISGLPEGFTATAEVTGKQVDAGESANTIASYTITKDGEDVTSKFTNVTLSEGTLTVTPYVLSFDCGGATYTFGDEMPPVRFSCNGNSSEASGEAGCYEAGFELETGDIVFLSVDNYPDDCMDTGEFPLSTDIGFDPGTASNYSASYTNTTVTINKRTVYVSKADESRDYNGQPGPVTTDVILEGDPLHLMSAELDYSATLGPDADEYQFKASTWVDYEHQDDYEIDESGMGKLTINPAPLSISSDEQVYTYDGTEHTLAEEDVNIVGLQNGETISLNLSNNSVTKGGTGVQPSATINWGSTKESNYDYGINLGKILVNKAPLTITSGDADKEYDGEPLTMIEDDYSITSGELFGEDWIAVTFTGSQTELGSSDNTFEIDYNESLNADCYEITKVYGTLTVTAPSVDDTLVFDFTPTDIYDEDYFFHATLTYRGEEIERVSESTIEGGTKYMASFNIDNGDMVTLTVSGLPLPSDEANVYNLDMQVAIAAGNGGDSRTYTPQYLHTTITKHDKMD